MSAELFTRTELEGVWLIRPPRFGDARGWFAETFRDAWLAPLGLPPMVQDNQSLSRARGTIRGLHFQTAPHAQAKIVRVVRGAALDVAVDLRAGSATFGRHVAVELSAEAGEQLVIPAGFAHGFCTLRDDTEVAYKVSAYYAREHDTGILWNDPDLGIAWPVAERDAIVSDKDRALPRLREYGNGSGPGSGPGRRA